MTDFPPRPDDVLVPPGGMASADKAYEEIRRRRGRAAADRIRTLAEQLTPWFAPHAPAWSEAEEQYDLEVAGAEAGTGWAPDA